MPMHKAMESEAEGNFIELRDEVALNIWQYDYSKGADGTHRWSESNPTNDLASIIPVPPTVKARVLLVQDLTEEFIANCRTQLGVPESFFMLHKSENTRARPVHMAKSSHCSSFRWSQLSSQDAETWKIECRIAKGLPWSLDTVRDPATLRFNHLRYERDAGIFRPYCPISKPSTPKMQHAARQAISTYWIHNSSCPFVLAVIDPIRKYRITERIYSYLRHWSETLKRGTTDTHLCFTDNEFCMSQRLLQELQNCAASEVTDGFVYQTQAVVFRILVEDTTEVLHTLHDALDEIDLSLSQDAILRSSLLAWRERFGFWRLDLMNTLVSIKEMDYLFEQKNLCPTCAPAPSSPNTLSQSIIELSRLKSEVEEVLSRLNSTFQAVMSTMSIVESQKAIQQSETISRLTLLATFFIPLSFVASVFGMNIVEFDQKLRVWMWVVVSVGVNLVTYGFFYASTIRTIIIQAPRTLRELNLQRIVTVTFHLLVVEVIPQAMSLIFLLSILSGLAVGLWKLYTSHLSVGAKVGISVATFVGPVLLALLASVLGTCLLALSRRLLLRKRLRNPPS